jgi:RecA/RadA recombinase
MGERIRIFVGAYGSGKTEVALNWAFSRAAAGEKVAIADLDLVNPFFRSRELRGELEAAGVRVLAPEGELAEADLPIIVPAIQGAIDDPDLHLILDVGGDDAGARALARFALVLRGLPHQVYMVLNDRRPWTGHTEGIEQTIARVQQSARMPVTALISNPNLGGETTPAVIKAGHATVVDAAAALGLPVAYLAVMGELVDQLLPDTALGVPVMPIQRHLFPPWYEDPTRFAPPRDQRSRVMREQIRARQAAPLGRPKQNQ